MFSQICPRNVPSPSSLPAAFLIGVQATNEMDELLRDELLGHDQLQLAEVGSLLL